MAIDDKLRFLEEIMDLDEGTLKLEDNLDDYEEWDSLSGTALIAEAKVKFGKMIDVTTLKSFETVKDICDFLG